MSRRSVFALALFLMGGCASMPGPDSPDHPLHGVTPDGVPKWVNRGSGAYEGEFGKAFYGVGILAGVQNPGLSRQTVDNRARAEIAKMFDLYVAAMMKDYQRSTTAGDFQASAEEQDIVSAQKTITEVTLRGVEVRDHWTDPQTERSYALAILDLNGIMKSLEDANSSTPRSGIMSARMLVGHSTTLTESYNNAPIAKGIAGCRAGGKIWGAQQRERGSGMRAGTAATASHPGD